MLSAQNGSDVLPTAQPRLIGSGTWTRPGRQQLYDSVAEHGIVVLCFIHKSRSLDALPGESKDSRTRIDFTRSHTSLFVGPCTQVRKATSCVRQHLPEFDPAEAECLAGVRDSLQDCAQVPS